MIMFGGINPIKIKIKKNNMKYFVKYKVMSGENKFKPETFTDINTDKELTVSEIKTKITSKIKSPEGKTIISEVLIADKKTLEESDIVPIKSNIEYVLTIEEKSTISSKSKKIQKEIVFTSKPKEVVYKNPSN